MSGTTTLRRGNLVRGAASIAAAALLSACAATHGPPMTATQEAATYVARAKPSYAPPGPPEDPWGPYIIEASKKYDVPERWVREVMRVESHGHEFASTGLVITSPVGAMGLMQVMPQTYDELRARYGLGDDAFDPHNNILAGTAYLREMYDAFGSPGFLAAYNGGPARLVDYLSHNRPLPAETRRYVAMIAPYIQGEWPQQRSPAEQYAVNQLPMDIPAGPRYPRHVNVAVAARSRRAREQVVRYAVNDRRHTHHAGPAPVELAEAPEPRAGVHASVHLASASVTHHSGFHLISAAYASEHVSHAVGGNHWTVRVSETTSSARLTHDAAVHTCRKTNHCVVVAPSARR